MTGRNAQGVKLINLGSDDRLLAIAPVINEDDGSENDLASEGETDSEE